MHALRHRASTAQMDRSIISHTVKSAFLFSQMWSGLMSVSYRDHVLGRKFQIAWGLAAIGNCSEGEGEMRCICTLNLNFLWVLA